jgi:ElaB/YqjD/DUF883 family membrane-anchored ribosome-binding protein
MASIIKRNGRKSRKSAHATKRELGSFFADVDDLLTRLAHLPDESIAHARERLSSSLVSARASVEEGVEKLVDSTTGAAKVTDDYVQGHPWKALGFAAAACFVLGTLLRRS